MTVNKIKIDSFGSLRDREFTFSDSLNIIEGANESGKTAAAMFIKFMFYGLSGRSSDAFPISERKRFVNWDTGCAAGELYLTAGEGRYRIERSLVVSDGSDSAPVRERTVTVDLGTGAIVKMNCEPGEYFFGMPEDVFVNTVFIRQLGTNEPDTSGVSAAIENILCSADETVDVKKVISKLDKVRRQLLHKNSSGGAIPELKAKISAAERELELSETENAAVIDAEASLVRTSAEIERAEKENETAAKVISHFEDIEALRMKRELAEADRSLEEDKRRLEEMKADFPARDILVSIKGVEKELAAEKASLERNRSRIQYLKSNAAEQTDADDCAAARDSAQKLGSRRRVSKVSAIITAILAVATCIAAVVMYTLRFSEFLVPAASGAVLLCATVVFASVSHSASKKFDALCAQWDADGEDSLLANIALGEEKARDAVKLAGQAKELADIADESERRIFSLTEEAAGLYTESTGDAPDEDMSAEDMLCRARECAEKKFAEIDALSETVKEKSGECTVRAMALKRYDFPAINLRRTEAELTPEWERAEKLTAEECAELRRKREFNDQKLRALYAKRTDYESKRSAGRARAVPPAQIAERIEAMRTELSDMTLRCDAVRLAIDTLESAGEKLRADVMPKIIKGASERFSAATLGRYSSLGVAHDFSMSYTGDAGTREAEYLSAGSADSAYISLRLSLAEVLFGKRTPPAVFDESFARIDRARLAEILAMQSLPHRQSLLFTCRELEAELAPEANIIKL